MVHAVQLGRLSSVVLTAFRLLKVYLCRVETTIVLVACAECAAVGATVRAELEVEPFGLVGLRVAHATLLRTRLALDLPARTRDLRAAVAALPMVSDK